MTGYTLCPKFSALSSITSQFPSSTDESIVFIDFDRMLNEIMDQWGDIGHQSSVNKSAVVSGVVQFVAEVISHYKQYFQDYSIILYHTDVESSPQLFRTGMENGNEYMLNFLSRFDTIKYHEFKQLYVEGLYKILHDFICAIPGVYLIKVKNIDSLVIPFAFAKEWPNKKIVVVTWDNVGSLLSYYTDNMYVVYDGRKVDGVYPAVVDGRRYIDTVTNAVNPNHYGKFGTQVLAAAVGNYKRSLYGIGKRHGGYDIVAQWLQNAFENSYIPAGFNDITVISSQIKQEDQRHDFEESYRGMDLEMQYQLLRDDERTEIVYKRDDVPIDPKDIIRMFPNVVFEWDKLFL